MSVELKLETIDWTKIIYPVVIILVAVAIYVIIKNITKRIMGKSRKRLRSAQKRQRVATMQGMIVNVEKYIVLFIALLAVLGVFGVNVTSMLAGLGIFTLLAGLALKDFATDIIAGVSIITEGEYDVGDVVEIDGFEGEVIGLGLKTTTIRNYRGQIKWIANRGITQVTNFTDGDFLAQVDVNAPYDAKSEEVEEALRQAGQKVTGVVPGAMGELQVLDIEDFADSAVVWRVRMLCKPNKHNDVERALRKEIKAEFEHAHISIPFPQIDVHQAR